MANEKILVVDDDKNICELLRLYLVKEGYNVTMVHDGAAALAEFDKLHPDLVLLDVMMPVMDGWEVCRKIRAKDNTPIIMLTAKGETYDKVLGLELGADDYIVKPFSMDVLICRINSLLESREKLKKLYGKKFSPEAMGIEIVSGDDRFTQSFFEIIEKNISNPELGVDLLSQELGLSRANLYRKLKAVTELSPTELIRNKRLEIAAKLLLESSYTVSEISVYTGFNSHAYFTNCFKSFYGYSPSEWVQRHNDKGETPK